MNTTLLDTTSFMKDQLQAIDRNLAFLLPDDGSGPAELWEASQYSVFSGGKRLRPLLALAATSTFGTSVESCLQPACVLELIHTYSMIHDDLPCMDDDDFRRGKPTLHRAYPEGTAVLAGDFLLTYAFELLATAPDLSDSQRIRLVAVLSQRCGGGGLIGGQVLDLAATHQRPDKEALERIHLGKTAALITASVEFGAIVADVGPDLMKALEQFGRSVGLAFQIVDDIIDITASEAKHGKSIGSDIANDKATYVAALGLDGAKAEAEKQYAAAIETLQAIDADTSLLEDLTHRMTHRSL